MPDNDGWSPCPVGAFSKLRKDLRAKTRASTRRQFLALSGVAAMGVTGLGIYVASNRRSAKLSCHEAADKISKFAARPAQLEDDPDLMNHLDHCAGCREYLEKLVAAQKSPPTSGTSPS